MTSPMCWESDHDGCRVVSRTACNGSATMTVSLTHAIAGHWIGGTLVTNGVATDSIDPATGRVIGRYVKAGVAEANDAIAAAKAAFRDSAWRHDRDLRSRVLIAMAELFEANLEKIVEILSLENGKIKSEARFEASMAAPTLRFNAALALTETGRAAQVGETAVSMSIRQPAGVAGIIAPWNSPVALMVRSLAPALAAGATTVVNLPGATAQTNAVIAELISHTPGLPVGAVNVLTGGHESADALVRSPDVPVISFTGSTRTGKAISATAAVGLKRLGLELGGKAPMIVFDDADLSIAIPKIVQALTVFAGQFCMTGSRVLVQSGIADDVRGRLAERLTDVRVGPAADLSSEMGPLISDRDLVRVDAMVEDAIAAGATAVVRGGPVTEPPLADGNFFRPCLLEVTDPSLPIFQEEVFGPVLTMMSFDTEAQAIDLANDSEYGLSASVFSTDADIPLRMALALEAGTVWVNDWAVLHNQFEEGGFKGSGQGRMRGFAVIDDFIEYKHVALAARASR